MSTPAKEGPEVPGKKKGGLLSRMKTVLKRSDGSKRLSFSSKPVATGSGPEPTEPVAESSAQPKSQPKPIEVAAADPTEQPQPPPGAILIMRSQLAAERARKLGERFAVTIEPLSTGPDRPFYRVEKPIRMRIHRTCHKCNTSFGTNKTCVSCQHVRCKSCPRYPVKKPEKKDKEKEGVKEVVKRPSFIEPDNYFGLREQLVLTKPNPKAGCQPLVRKKPMQRVRRTCHECETLYQPGSRVCVKCSHTRCEDCPRDPPKKHKFPNGYPGDAPSSNPNKPIKYACHKCNKAFPPVPNPASEEGKEWRESGKTIECERCKHSLCGECSRVRPVMVERGPDPEVLERVRVKLAALSVDRGE